MDDYLKCDNCSPEDHDGKFCRCESRNIRIAKEARSLGESEWKKDGLPEHQLQHMHKCIMDMFLGACDTLVKEDLDDPSFQFCLDTIQNTLIYVKSKRREKQFQLLQRMRDIDILKPPRE